MITIIEGADGTGKTTLARQLEDRLNAVYVKSPIKPIAGEAIDQRADRWALDLMLESDRDYVVDRFFPSEYVYDAFYARDFDPEEVEQMDYAVADAGGLGILLTLGTRDQFARRLQDDDVPASDCIDLQSQFRAYVKRSRMDWIELHADQPVELLVEQAMLQIIQRRPERYRTYMNIAFEVARRSTCLSRRSGGVLLSKSGHVIATGYNGAPRGMEHQTVCSRLRCGAESGTGLDACMDVHSEENCIAQAANLGISTSESTLFTIMSPCSRCARMLINAGVETVVYNRKYGDENGLTLLEKAGVGIYQI